MKRYTRDARTLVMWDRHDIVTSGPGCESGQLISRKLVELAMAAVRACRKTSMGIEKGSEQLTALAEWGENIARDAGVPDMGDVADEQIDGIEESANEHESSQVEQGLSYESGGQPRAPPVPIEMQISECAPKEARTKGRKRGGKQVLNDNTNSNKAPGKRACGFCGSLGHYSTSCDLNPENANKKRGASGSLRGKMGRKRGRPPTKRQLDGDFEDVA